MSRSVLFCAFGLILPALLAIVVAPPQLVHAAACTPPSTDYGTVSGLSSNIAATGTYRIWSRMAAPNSSDNTYMLEVDGSSCYTVGGSGVPVYPSGTSTYFNNNSTNWVSTTSTGVQIDVSLTAGTHTFKLIGQSSGVVVDRLIMTQDTSCIPTGTGDNCASADVTPPVISAVTASSITQTTATITWTTDELADCQVEYGTAISYGSSTTINSSLVTAHALSLSGLQAGTTYHYRVKSKDASTNLATSTDKTFTTTDTTAPTVSITAPTAGSTVSNTISISANASDNVGVVGVQFKIDGANQAAEDISSPYSISWDTTGVTNGSHSITAVARDAAGNTKTSTSVSITVSNAASFISEDINQDGHVNILDFSVLASKYGQSGASIGRADINGDGVVNILDFSRLAAKYGT